MLGLTFLAPLFLAGTLSAAIPLVIHLSRSKRTKTLRFSTTRFFTDSFVRSYRMSRLKEWALLACRMALFALFALALARPLLGNAGAGGTRSVVLVVDASASMGATDDGQTLLARVKVAGNAALAALKPGDMAALLSATRRDTGTTAVIPALTEDTGEVRRALDALAVTTLGADLPAAVREAGRLLRASPASSKEIVVLTDLQDAGWEVPEGLSTESSDATVTVLQFRPPAPENLAVTAVQFAAARPVVGVPFEFRPLVAFQGPPASANVRLVVDGKPVAERGAERPGGGSFASPRFQHAFDAPGWHSGYVEVEDAVWPGDNRRHFALEVAGTVPVLAVNGAPSAVAARDELFFLRAALGAGGGAGRASVAVTVVSADELAAKSSEQLSAFPLVILANVESISPDAARRLEEYAEAGGRVWFWAGDRVTAAGFNAAFASPARPRGGLSPAKLVTVRGDAAGPEAADSAGDFDATHPALSAFADTKFASLSAVRFKALWEVETLDGSRVLLRSAAGRALITERPFGRGVAVLCAFPCDRDWGDLPVKAAFLPLVHRLAGHLATGAGRAAEPFRESGRAVPLARPAPGVLAVELPDGTTVAPTPVAGEDSFTLPDTEQTGVYVVSVAGRPEAESRFAVNLDAYESEAVYLDDVFGVEGLREGVAKLLPGHAPALVRVSSGREPAALTEVAAPPSFRLADGVLCCVLAIALLEPLMANWITLRHYARPTEGGAP